MIYYLMKIGLKPYKVDEFIACTRSLVPKILKEKDCNDFNVYVNSEKEDTFVVVGEWNIREAMEAHFHKKNFEILIGSARVLGKTMEMNISEVIESGGFEMAKEYNVLPRVVENSSD